MKFLSHIRSNSKLKSIDQTQNYPPCPPYGSLAPSHPWATPNPTASFSPDLLEQLFTYICPHSRDSAYVPCEESMVDAGCMLCDMWDLAQCTLVNRQWWKAGRNILYHNVRIDAVHYCDREIDLACKRKRRSWVGQSTDWVDPPRARLQLFSRTVRESASLAFRVHSLKLPYMTRESSQADLARTVSVLPNLRYVDLPDGFYTNSSSSNVLKHELQSRCPDIRQMKYMAGAEGSFQTLAHAGRWPNLEKMQLYRLSIEPSTLTSVLAVLLSLRELDLVGLPLLDDSALTSRSDGQDSSQNAMMHGTSPVERPCDGIIPPLAKLAIKEAPGVTTEGLVAYLSHPQASNMLSILELSDTGVPLAEIHIVLAAAPHLTTLTVSETVSRHLPLPPPPPLTSRSLRTLHYEITSPTPCPSESYYDYVSGSILAGALPSLSNLYALSMNLPTLLLPKPRPAFAPDSNGGALPRPPPNPGLKRPLNLYTKSISEMEWNLTFITPPTTKNRQGSASVTRPLSLYQSTQLSPQYKGRESVIVGNGFGGFLMVPGEDTRPGSPRMKQQKKERDAWMG